VKVLDFGIVKLADSTLTLGSDSGAPGTPAYMSPEHVGREEIDGRADLYSVGVILYRLMAGRPPFYGKGVAEILYQHVHEAPEDVRVAAGGAVSEELAQIIHSCLAKRREDRPKDARTLRRLLESVAGGPSFVGGVPSVVPDEPQPTRPMPSDVLPVLEAPGGLSKWWIAAILVFVPLVVAGLVQMIDFGSSSSGRQVVDFVPAPKVPTPRPAASAEAEAETETEAENEPEAEAEPEATSATEAEAQEPAPKAKPRARPRRKPRPEPKPADGEDALFEKI
jgi:serine/threonine-protein kinase